MPAFPSVVLVQSAYPESGTTSEEQSMTTIEPRHDVLGDATLGELAEALRGELVRPEDPTYDEARSIWNAAHDKKPALIVRCRGVADVIRRVQFAGSTRTTYRGRGVALAAVAAIAMVGALV